MLDIPKPPLPPDLPPHLTALIFAHVDLALGVAMQLVAGGLPKPSALLMLMEHASRVRALADGAGVGQAGKDVAAGIEVFAVAQFAPDQMPPPTMDD